jgi:uncharacterized membrane protein (DUF2068 family)
MKRPDLVVLIAVWELATAFFASIGILVLALLAFAPESLWYGDRPLLDGDRIWVLFGISIAAFVLLAYITLAVVSAVGLLRGREFGRITAIVQGALLLPGFPVGTVIGILQLAYLMKPEVKEYFGRKAVSG